MMRIGILGCGYFGAEFARAIEEMDGSEVVGLYSPGEGAKRLSKELGCHRAETVDEILNDKTVDAVVIATPNYLHYAHVLAAAKAGKHIFCEKPFALSKAEAKEMVKSCEEAGVILMVGHIMHFYSGIAEIKRRIDQGEFGRILTMHIERTGWEQKKEVVSWKKVQEQSGGHLFHHIHEIDILQWIMGLPTNIYTMGGNLGHNSKDFGNEDDVLLLMASFGKDAFATLQYGSGFRIGNHIIRINGEKAGAVIDFKKAVVFKSDDCGIEEWSLFGDEESGKAIRALFAKTDGGISYGSPQERPPRYILEALRAELRMFCGVVMGAEIAENKKDLFDGTSAINSVCIAEMGICSRNSGTIEVVS